MTALNKQALRQLAEKATPGPWEMEHENIWFRDTEGYTKHLMYAYQGDDVDDQQDYDNTAYIAAFNPKVVLALLDELEDAENRIAEMEARTVTLPPTFWYEHDDLSRDIPVLDKRLVKKAIRAAGIGVKGE